MDQIVTALYNQLWGFPTILLFLSLGLWISIRTHFVQVIHFPRAFRYFCAQIQNGAKQSSPYHALCTALAATVGTGNLVGVAGAICLGGPGVVFWMLTCGFIGMAIKYAEAALAVHYQQTRPSGILGGPMYMIQNGLPTKWKYLAYCYSFLGLLACLGVGNAVQANTIISSLSTFFPVSKAILIVLLSFSVGAALCKGATTIGRIIDSLIPFSAAAYVLLCLVFLFYRRNVLPDVFHQIIYGIFSPKSVTGGIIGSSFRVIQVGCSRALFSNEAGMGTASIAHGSASVKNPYEQGMMGMVEVFLDTIVICTLTALVILCSGYPLPFGQDCGSTVTVNAFSVLYGKFGKYILSFFLICFSYATILGWTIYGLRCAQFLFGNNIERLFLSFHQIITAIGAAAYTPLIWKVSEILNGALLIPNSITLILLTPALTKLLPPKKRCQEARHNVIKLR